MRIEGPLAPWEPVDVIDRFLGDRADAIDWAYIDNLPPDDCRDIAKECIRRLHELVGVRPALGSCAKCGGDIWLDIVRPPWAPDAVFHVACDWAVIRAVVAILGPTINGRAVIDWLDMSRRCKTAPVPSEGAPTDG